MELKCINCKQVKPLDDYYQNKSMPNGYGTKCKECCKKQAKERELRLREDPEWVEQEKIRAREKYHRLQYKDKHKPNYESKKLIINNYNGKYPEKVIAKNISQRIKPLTKGNQLHHWSYNKVDAKDVIELSIRHHKKLHRYLVYDTELFMYRRIDTNELLNTRELHEAYMFDVIANKPD